MTHQRVASVLVGQALQTSYNCNEEKQPARGVSRLPRRDESADEAEAERDHDVLDVGAREPVDVTPVGDRHDDRENSDGHGKDGRADRQRRGTGSPRLLRCTPAGALLRRRRFFPHALTVLSDGRRTMALAPRVLRGRHHGGADLGRSRTRPSLDFGSWVNLNSAFPVRPRSPLAWSAPRAVP